MPKTKVTAVQWSEFRKFAVDFYTECMAISVEVAGEKNSELIQLVLEKVSPELLDLLELWDGLDIELHPTAPVDTNVPVPVPLVASEKALALGQQV